MKPSIVIPTYWTAEDGIPTDRLFNIYDHPTPINQSGTLARTLQSLKDLEGDFQVVIIGAVTEPELKDKLVEKIQQIIAKFPSLDIILFTYPQLKTLHERIKEIGQEDLIPALKLEGYSNIRNIGLVIAQLLGSEVTLLIDDDEVVIDKEYVKKALQFMGESRGGNIVYGKSGYYLKNEQGEYLDSDEVPWWDRFWKKGWAMNQVLKTVSEKPRLKKTSLALGGAMVLHQKMFEKVSFDPYALRGEDFDYLINAKMTGFEFFLDNELSVLHLPPPKLSHVLGLRQDIYRFTYEHEKLKYAETRDFDMFDIDDLDPFPGRLLRSNIYFKSFMISFLTSIRDIIQRDFWLRMKNIKVALRDAKAFAKRNRHRYFGFRYRWSSFMEAIKEDEVLKEELLTQQENR